MIADSLKKPKSANNYVSVEADRLGVWLNTYLSLLTVWQNSQVNPFKMSWILNNTSCIRLIIIIDFNVNVDQTVIILELIYRYAVTDEKLPNIPFLCKKFYTLVLCTFEAVVHYLELVQAPLYRHKYTYFSKFNCDILIPYLCSGNLISLMETGASN